MASKGMSIADAKAILAELDSDWVMPEEWWQVESEALSLHVSEETAKAIIDRHHSIISMTDSDFAEFTDMYGALIYIRFSAIEIIFRSTKLSRAKWIAGVPVRQWRDDDEKPDWEE